MDKDMQLLVDVLRAGLMPLIFEGLITKERAEERARNQATALVGHFALKRRWHCETCDKAIDKAEDEHVTSGDQLWCSEKCMKER